MLWAVLQINSGPRPTLPNTPIRLTLLPLLLVFVFSIETAFAQRIVAKVDRKQVSSNETINLTVMTDQHVSTDALDFSVLEQDFEILTLRPVSRSQVINGQSSSQTTWQLELLPTRDGKMVIPEFSLNSVKTNPIAITVTKAAPGKAQTIPLIATVEFNKDEAFVNEQFYFTLEITADATVNHIQGGPSLNSANAEVTLVAKNAYKKTIGNKPFEIIEHVYAIFASKPGPIEVPSGIYRGWLKVKPTRANNFQQAQPVVAKTPPLKILIRDPAQDSAASTKSPWFPAQGVAISSSWTGDKDAMRVGEPITRTIRIEAAGQRAAAIPPVVFQSTDFKQYAEQPVLKDGTDDGNVVGVRTDSVAIVPSRSGELSLPPVAVNWWDTQAGTWRTATLPAEVINVAPAVTTPESDTRTPAVVALPAVQSVEPPRLNWLTGALGVLCGLLSLICVWLITKLRAIESKTSSRSAADTSRGTAHGDDTSRWRELNDAIKSEQPELVRQSIIRWSDSAIPEAEIKQLTQIGAISGNDQLREALSSLDSTLYRNASTVNVSVDYTKLRQELEKFRSAARNGELTATKTTNQALPELYLAQNN